MIAVIFFHASMNVESPDAGAAATSAAVDSGLDAADRTRRRAAAWRNMFSSHWWCGGGVTFGV